LNGERFSESLRKKKNTECRRQASVNRHHGGAQ